MKELNKLLISSFLISIFGILLVSKESKFLNWIVLVFGIIGLILAILKVIFPKAKFLMNYIEKAELNKKSFHEIYTDEGIFEFYSDGFYIDKLKNPELINWKKIKSIIAYKKDLITTDLIIAEIITDQNIYNVNEETPRWFYFVDQINKTLNIKDKNWNINITQTPFARNLTLIYDSENRTLKEFVKENNDYS